MPLKCCLLKTSINMHLFKICKRYYNYLNVRLYCNSFPRIVNAELDWDYFNNPSNREEIINNCKLRDVNYDITAILDELHAVQEINQIISTAPKDHAVHFSKEKLIRKIAWLPNKTHPKVLQNETSSPVLLEEIGTKPFFSYYPATFDSLAKRLNTIRTEFLGPITGSRSYYLKNDFAELEQALIKFTLERLIKKGFNLVSVPDIISKAVLEGCGMKTENKHSQIFHIDKNWGESLCLSGTAEMSLAAFMAKKMLSYEKLPLRLCSVSRCFRAEATRTKNEKGIFRVHLFTKVEMFGITANENGNESELLLEEFSELQRSLFSELGLHFQVLEMPPCDLGLPAYHKIDIEAWMPGRNMYGEISSASNCTDYQSRRLKIKYSLPHSTTIRDQRKHCHTVNGTACAIPRMLIAIIENFQNYDGSINVPEPLQKYLHKMNIKKNFSDKMRCMKPTP